MAPNVVLLTIDSLRADHATRELMPNLHELATSGVQFTRAYANGYSTPISFPTILTGTYASHYGGHKYLVDERPFLAKRFEQAGYRTAAFHTNPHLRAAKNYDVGFEHFNDFDDEAGELSRMRYLVTRKLPSDSRLYSALKRIYHLIRTKSGSTDYAPAPEINNRALNWLDDGGERDGPFFLWNHYMDVHYPFYPPPEFLDRAVSTRRAIDVNGRMHEDSATLTVEEAEDLRALYRGDVRYFDHHLGEFVDALENRGLFEDTLFAITSDHGELFGEHGLFGHPRSCYEESLHVPFVLLGPRVSEAGRVEAPVSLLDLAPTVSDLAGVEAAGSWEGISLQPTIEGADPPGDRTIFVGDVDAVIAAQMGNLRLVHWQGHDCPLEPDREWELLHLESGEVVPIEDHVDAVERLRGGLKEFEARARAEEAVEEPTVGGATAKQLEALGYK